MNRTEKIYEASVTTGLVAFLVLVSLGPVLLMLATVNLFWDWPPDLVIKVLGFALMVAACIGLWSVLLEFAFKPSAQGRSTATIETNGK